MYYVEPVPSGVNDLTDSSLMSQQKWQVSLALYKYKYLMQMLTLYLSCVHEGEKKIWANKAMWLQIKSEPPLIESQDTSHG